MTTSTQPNQGVQGWHSADHAALVTAKGWKTADDVLGSYSQLESHIGAPADRLIRIPDAAKIDDTFRSDVFKRIGYSPASAPAKPEDYGLATIEGGDAEWATGVAAAAHKAGITVEQMKALAAFNQEYATKRVGADKEANEKTWGERNGAVNAKLKERFGDKFDAMNGKLGLEAMRVGGFKTAEELEAFERDLAMSGDNSLAIWRNALADLAEVRREAPLHKDGGTGTMNAEQAKAELARKSADKDWVGKALTRGTPEAEENLRLNLLASGGTINEDEIKRMAKGLTAQPSGA